MALHNNSYTTVYEDCGGGVSAPMRVGEERTEEPGVPAEAKIIGTGTAIGGAWGASMAMSATSVPAGVAASGGFVTVGAAAGGGLAASAVGGFGLGTIIGEWQPVKDALTSLLEWGLKEPGGHQHIPLDSDGCLRPSGNKDGTWEFEFQASGVILERQAWFYVGDGVNTQASFEADWTDGGIEVFSDPFAALDYAQMTGVGGVMDELHMIFEMR